MSAETKSVRLRVVSDEVLLPNLSTPVPRGDYDGYVYWETEDDGESHMTSAQLMLEGIPSMHAEVLRYLKSGAIVLAG